MHKNNHPAFRSAKIMFGLAMTGNGTFLFFPKIELSNIPLKYK